MIKVLLCDHDVKGCRHLDEMFRGEGELKSIQVALCPHSEKCWLLARSQSQAGTERSKRDRSWHTSAPLDG